MGRLAMKSINLYIPKYDWVVRVYIGMCPEYAEEVIDLLYSLGCSRKNVRKAKKSLRSRILDTGLTFSDRDNKTSVMVINKTSSAKEFLDSLVHETMHLSVHIAEYFGIDLTSEELCYIGGDVARSLYPYCKEYLCCKCNK